MGRTRCRRAADAAGEPVWQLPLPSYLRGKLDSELADLKNITSTRYGGALAAGVFLQEFVGEGIPWAHLDIAGPADSSEVEGEIVQGRHRLRRAHARGAAVGLHEAAADHELTRLRPLPGGGRPVRRLS